MATKPDEVNPFAQYVEQPKEAPNPFAQYAQNRTAGEALVTDPISSFLGGLGGALSSPTQVSRLITGEKPPAEAKGTTESLLDTLLPFGGKPSDIASTALEKLTPSAPSVQSVTDLALNPFAKFAPVGAELSSFADKHKSAGLKNSETELSNKINAANGFFNEAGVAVAGTLTNPALLSDFIFSQIPNMAGPLGGGAISKELVHAFFKDATVKTLDRAAVSGAVATAAAMQGGDIGSDTYKTINDRLIKEGMDPEKAHTIALEKARVAAAEAAAISVASSFIPGGQALERRFLTQAGKESAKKGGTSLLSKITNVVGESSQEGIEEGGGKLASNVQVQQVFPETDIMKGVGAATGQGAIGGGLFGGISNIRGHGTTQANVPPTVPPSATPPGVQSPTTPGAPPVAPVSSGLVSPEDLETSVPSATQTIPPVAGETQKEKIAKLMAVKPNNPEVETEGLQIVQELKRLGQVPFAEGMEANIKSGGFETSAQLDFYRQKLEEAQQLAQEEGKAFHEEHSIDKYLSSHKADQKRFTEFLPKAPEPIQALVVKSNDYLQKLTDQINAKGYKLLDVDSRAPQDVQELKAQISGIAGSTVSLVKNAEHIEKENRFANPEKFEKISNILENDYSKADQLLGTVNEEKKPAEPEAVQEVANVPEEAQAPIEDQTAPEAVQVSEELLEPEQPSSEVTPQTVLENLIANKDDVIQKIEKSYDITPEKAAQVYEAEKEYREAVEKYGYAPNLDPEHEVKYMAAVNRHRQFFNRLSAAQKKKKVKPVADTSKTIDVQAKEITPSQTKLLENQVKTLSEKEIDKLENHYGHHNKSGAFLQRLSEDIIAYTNKGAQAVDAAIRNIIAKLQAGVLAVAMVFNPAYMSQQTVVVYPAKVTVEQVKAAVPEQAKEMSDSGKKAFATLFAALQPELQAKNKLFTVVDKPTSKVFVFNPDGSMLVKDNVVLGMAMGDTYVGKTDFKENRITPAGMFNVTAEKGGATYDGKTIYTVGNVQEGWNTAFMHTVYLKEADAAARKKGLETGEGTRLSHGCVNASPEVMEKIGEDNRMDGSHVFVVPDNQTKIDDYIANNVSNEDLTRSTVEPAKKTTTTPEIKVERKQLAREEEAIEPRKSKAEINRERQADRKNKSQAAQEMVQPNVEPVKKKTAKERVQEIHEEQISEYTKLRQRLSHLTRKVSEGKISLGIQREITDLLELTRDLKQDIKLTTPKNNTAEHFYKRALDEFTKGNITRDVLDVVKYFYDNNPEILNGIKLSVRQTDQEGHMGNFAPLQRLVTLYKEAGANSPETARHEIMHSLEQMMNSDTRQAIIDAWKDALEMAIKQYGQDQRASMYFNTVLDFINNPNEANFKRAVSIMPSKDLYQFINPSEFWAVNAEKLMAAKMGTPWAKFVKFMKMLGEGLKKLFGLENQYAVHKAFNELLNGNGKRMDKQSLTSYMHAGELDFEFLNDIKDIEDLMDKHNRPEVAVHTSRTVTDRLLGGYEEAKAIKAKIMENPKAPIIGMVGTLDRGLLNARVQTTNFIAGLEAADRAKYAGELEDGQKRAIASVAMTQALKAARIGTRVILMGKLAFDEVHQIFKAVEDKYSMANIMTLKHQLEKQLGSKLAAKTINSYLEAKRSKSINQEFADRNSQLERITALLEVPTLTETERADLIAEQVEAQEDVKQISIAMDKVNMDEEAIEEFIALEKDLPQLKEIMKNWNHVNKNMINMMEFSKIISAKRAETLRNIEDYVPWYRVQDDQEDVHQGTQSAKGVRNISREKRFKEGKVTEDINDIVDNMLHNVMVTTRNSIRNFAANRIAQEYAERNEKGKIRVYPAEDFDKGIVRIMVNGKKINVKISDPLIAQSVIGIESFQMPMNNMMAGISNFLRRSITLSGIFQVKQLFMDAPTAALVAGVKHPYKLYAGVFGSFLKALAPTALKPVDYVINKFTPFTTNLSKEDPIIELLLNHGIGGYHSMARTAEREFKQQIGLLSKSKMAQIADIFDKIGDASDIAQRRAVYNRVMAETNGDQRAAIMGANNIIDFDKRGANGFVNGLNRTVAFMNAYAQQIDVLTQALGEVPAGAVEKLTGAKITSVSGNLHGLNRNEAMTRLMWAGFLLTMTTLAYTSMVGDDDDYKKLDDQTRMRNFFIPRSLTKHIGMDKPLLIPMHTSAAFYYKSIPEMLFNKQMKEGTKDTIDKTRLHTALGKAFLDSMLGPLATGPIPSAFKPGVEIALNHSFYMGGNITPTGMKDLAAFDQIKGSTSELGKWLSSATQIPGTAKTNPDGTVKENSRSRMLNPIEADYVMRSLGGTMASIAMWGSNLFSGERPSPTEHDNILYGSFVAPDIPRGREDLFYDLQGRSNEAYKTYTDLMKNGRAKEGDQWFKDNQDLITANGYTEGVSKGLQSINAEIRRTEKVPSSQFTPEEKRQRIDYLKKTKEDMLQEVIQYRLKAGL